MSVYNARRGLNMSQYIDNLNSVPILEQHTSQGEFDIDTSLALFTNADFDDIDGGLEMGNDPMSYEGLLGDQTGKDGLQPVVQIGDNGGEGYSDVFNRKLPVKCPLYQA